MVREGTGRHAGRWNLPGGGVQAGESLTRAIVREAAEETGLAVEPTRLAGVYSYINRKQVHALRFAMHCRITGGEPAADGKKILEVRWFGLDQLNAMPDEQLKNPRVLRCLLDDITHRSTAQRAILRELDAA